MSNASKTPRMSAQKRRTKDFIPLTERVKIERSLGFNISSNASLDCDSHTSTIAYPAGCVLVLHDLQTNNQVHIQSPFKKSISALSFSADGKYIVTGECGHNPMTRVWDIQARMQIAEFSGHTNGINCVAFSPNLKYVVSIGSQHDMIVNVWEWKQNKKIASNKVSSKVKSLAFASDGKYFVTVGNRHAKFWYLHYSGGNSKAQMDTVPLMGRSAILGQHGNCYFRCVGTGVDHFSEFTYAVTKNGILCEFNSRRIIERHVKLSTDCANCLYVGRNIIYVGCSNGEVFGYSPTSHDVIILPQPHSLGVDIAQGLIGSFPVHTSDSRSPHTMALTFDQKHKKLVCVYSDHSMYVWDVQDLNKIKKFSSFLYHSGCIWGIQVYPDNVEDPTLPPESFITCSNDDTVRIWNLDNPIRTNIYSAQLFKIFYTDPKLCFICDLTFNSLNLDTVYDSMNGVRCLKIDPDGSHLATGDRSGSIRIYDLNTMTEQFKMDVHDGEVLSLGYSPYESGKKLLASSSRDRFIHVFDITKNYEKIQTVFGHSSSITMLCFVHRKNNLYLISCSADKSIIFRQLDVSQDSFIRQYNAVCKTSLYDMEVDIENQNLLTVSMDRLVRIYSVSGSNKCIRSFKGSEGDQGSLLKVVLDPSAILVATSCTDKNIYIYSYQTGECVAILYGHAEIITGLAFTNDGNKIISVSGDGCIFVWSIPPELYKCSIKKQRPLTLSKSLQNIGQLDKTAEENKEQEFLLSNPKYTFSVSNLPLWAKKQVKDVMTSSFTDSSENIVPSGPRGRWAQKLNDKPLVLHSYLDSETLLPPPTKNIWESYAVQDNSLDQNEESLNHNESKTLSNSEEEFFSQKNDSSTHTVIQVTSKKKSCSKEELCSELGSSDEFYIVLDDDKGGSSEDKDNSEANVRPDTEGFSEEEDGITTPLDGGPFNISTENLECVDQREKFLKSSYENFDNSFLIGTEQRQSISRKVFSKMCGDDTYTIKSSSNSSQNGIHNSRSELNQALQDTKKMLNSTKWKDGGAFKNSKSIANLHSESMDSVPLSYKKIPEKVLRRATSMATLSLPPISCERVYSNGFDSGNTNLTSPNYLHTQPINSTPHSSRSVLNLPEVYDSPYGNVSPISSLTKKDPSNELLSNKYTPQRSSIKNANQIGSLKTKKIISRSPDPEANGQITFETCQDMVKNLKDIASTISYTYQLLNSFNCEESDTMKGILNHGVNQANEILNSVASKDDALLNDPRILSLLQKYSEKLVDQLTPR